MMELTHVSHPGRKGANKVQASFSTTPLRYLILKICIFAGYLDNWREEQMRSIAHPTVIVRILITQKAPMWNLPDPSELIQRWYSLQRLRSCMKDTMGLLAIFWKPESGAWYGKEGFFDNIEQDITDSVL
jgi:hypothetical protein